MRKATDELFTYFECTECGALQMECVPENLGSYYEEESTLYETMLHMKAEAEGAEVAVSDVLPRQSALRGALRRAGRKFAASDGIGARVLGAFYTAPAFHAWFARAGVTKESMILDVGCSVGEQLAEISEQGYYNASGIDAFIARDIKYDNGLVIRKGTLADVAGTEQFDLVMMNHSLEHAPDPVTVFAELGRLVTRAGTVLLRVPIVASQAWEEYSTDWVQLDCPRHLFLYTEKAIALLAKEAGLKVDFVEYDSWELQFYGSELLRQGILIGGHDGFLEDSGKETLGKETFGKGQMEKWRARAEELNRQGRGDMATFYLKVDAGSNGSKDSKDENEG
ncbi:MAG: class I SAM-dependent methyltransferase [Proteobacteria bacterium]|nr:class I SAM-dependent methyltransferase [Pseudomonadota bacterium]